ncbi:unnamed protein product [Vitrella brassicaformis CCMP3155]|uniref:Uncharacterized protein n=1 Tax=Vitrella brassicaformis (strain CCMP3155) TaxID=1169540 RepID=A0A0G4FA81_VITBC|nr:unnamed protein product [Vitrella brassicaformis CCMP3155]|eukprot:CEM09216.1 unnamed protein product [Vitrella brassicaformis CCMP3155]
MQQDGNDGHARPEATRDEGLRRFRREMDRIEELIHTLEAQVAGNDASLTGRDLSVVVGHVSRGGGCLKEAVEHLNNIHNTNSLQGGVAEGDCSGRAEELAVEGTQKATHETSVSVAGVSDSKRARVVDGSSCRHAAAAAAAAAAAGGDGGGVSSGPQQDGQGHDQQQQPTKVVGGPSRLCGLEGPLLCDIASWLTTIEATVLCLLNRGINGIADCTPNHHPSSAQDGSSKATPFGIYRNLTIAEEEVETWSNLDLATQTRLRGKLGNVTTARIPSSTGPYEKRNASCHSFVATCLEAAKASLKHLYIGGDRGTRRAPWCAPPPVAFTALTNLHVERDTWIEYFGDAHWTFPALVDCQGLNAPATGIAPRAVAGITQIVRSSPQLTTLAIKDISDCGSRDFIAALGQYSRLSTIRGLRVTKEALRNGHIADLQRSLDAQWSKPEMQGVKKTIEFVYGCPIDHNLGDLTRPLRDFLAWARRVSATVEWRSGACVTVDCSTEPLSATAPIAVRGPVADAVKEVAQKANRMWLFCGGYRTPLDESWKDVLNFPNVTQLWIRQCVHDDHRQSAEIVSDSIPPFMTEVDEDGNNVCFPRIEHLDLTLAYILGSHPPEGAWHFSAGPNKLSTLLGSLRHVGSVQFRTSDLSVLSECLPLLPTERIDEVSVVFCDNLRALPDACQPLTRPAVTSLWSDDDDLIDLSKDQALSVMSVVTHVRPSKAHLSLHLLTSEFELDEEGASDEEQIAHAEQELRALACECFERVMASYSLDSLTIQCDMIEDEWGESFLGFCVLTLDLVAKGQQGGDEGERGVVLRVLLVYGQT